MERFYRGDGTVNLGPVERWLSVMGGSALLMRGWRDDKKLALLGAGLIYRGVTGHSYLYQFLGVTSVPREGRTASIPYRQGIRLDETITINQSPDDVYRFWRNLQNLPRFMQHLISVTEADARHSQWVAKGPAGKQVEWNAEIISDVQGEMISWRSLAGSDVDTAGSVHFNRAPANGGTEVKVELQYLPPGGIASALLAKLFGENPERQVREDLRRLKQLMEAGELPKMEEQPAGPGLHVSSPAWNDDEGRSRPAGEGDEAVA